MYGKALVVSFKCEKPVRSKGSRVRGFLGNLYPEEILLHHHETDKQLRYSYARIQCKVSEGSPIIVGIDDGLAFVQNLFITLDRFELGRDTFLIMDRKATFDGNGIGISENRRKYVFLTPWLALNEKNYQRYQRSGSETFRRQLLEDILVGNILSMSKGLGYTVPGIIKASISWCKEVYTSLKGNPMLGFLGEFEVNFEIPDYLGLGKSVSRGFGTVKRVG